MIKFLDHFETKLWKICQRVPTVSETFSLHQKLNQNPKFYPLITLYCGQQSDKPDDQLFCVTATKK